MTNNQLVTDGTVLHYGIMSDGFAHGPYCTVTVDGQRAMFCQQ